MLVCQVAVSCCSQEQVARGAAGTLTSRLSPPNALLLLTCLSYYVAAAPARLKKQHMCLATTHVLPQGSAVAL